MKAGWEACGMFEGGCGCSRGRNEQLQRNRIWSRGMEFPPVKSNYLMWAEPIYSDGYGEKSPRNLWFHRNAGPGEVGKWLNRETEWAY